MNMDMDRNRQIEKKEDLHPNKRVRLVLVDVVLHFVESIEGRVQLLLKRVHSMVVLERQEGGSAK